MWLLSITSISKSVADLFRNDNLLNCSHQYRPLLQRTEMAMILWLFRYLGVSQTQKWTCQQQAHRHQHKHLNMHLITNTHLSCYHHHPGRYTFLCHKWHRPQYHRQQYQHQWYAHTYSSITSTAVNVITILSTPKMPVNTTRCYVCILQSKSRTCMLISYTRLAIFLGEESVWPQLFWTIVIYVSWDRDIYWHAHDITWERCINA